MKRRYALPLATALAILIAPWAASATTWQAVAGIDSFSGATQAEVFLPNELWVHVGDSITWAIGDAGEAHTVTFLPLGQVRPSGGTGCPGATPDHASFDGSACVNSGSLLDVKTYTVTFPTAGNFKVVCLVHANMAGTVHVLEPTQTLPYLQAFYDDQAYKEQFQLLADGVRLERTGAAAARLAPGNHVTTGIGEIIATGGGTRTVSIYRFRPESIVVRIGDTVEWTNLDPVTSHTVTFGAEPSGSPQPPSAGVTMDLDGARRALIASPTDSVHSGFLTASTQDRIGLTQAPPGVTRFRVTFTTPGIFDYICAIHDQVAMTGQVIVRGPAR